MKYWTKAHLLGLLALSGSALALAEKNSLSVPFNTSGWGGYLQLLVGEFSTEGLEKVVDGNENLSFLDAASISYNEDFVFPLWQVNYTFEHSKTMVYLGMPNGGLIESESTVEAGISHELNDGTMLSASYTPKYSEFRSDAWQDPTLTGKNRTQTDTELQAINIEAAYIAGSPLSLGYSYGELSYDHDQAGQSLGLRLTPHELKQLQRDERYQHTELSLTFPVSDNLYLTPGASHIQVNAKGDANSRTSTSLNLTIAYLKNNFELFAHGYFKTAEYDEPNPVFRKKREDDSSGITTGISYLKPFNWENIKLDLIVGQSQRDSNIHFFDSNEEFLATGITYEF